MLIDLMLRLYVPGYKYKGGTRGVQVQGGYKGCEEYEEYPGHLI